MMNIESLDKFGPDKRMNIDQHFLIIILIMIMDFIFKGDMNSKQATIVH